jgi:hypothetical protein
MSLNKSPNWHATCWVSVSLVAKSARFEIFLGSIYLVFSVTTMCQPCPETNWSEIFWVFQLMVRKSSFSVCETPTNTDETSAWTKPPDRVVLRIQRETTGVRWTGNVINEALRSEVGILHQLTDSTADFKDLVDYHPVPSLPICLLMSTEMMNSIPLPPLDRNN